MVNLLQPTSCFGAILCILFYFIFLAGRLASFLVFYTCAIQTQDKRMEGMKEEE